MCVGVCGVCVACAREWCMCRVHAVGFYVVCVCVCVCVWCVCAGMVYVSCVYVVGFYVVYV